MRLYSRPGNDLTHRFPLIVETLAGLRARSCIIDGEAVACDDSGVASFELVRHQRANGSCIPLRLRPAADFAIACDSCNSSRSAKPLSASALQRAYRRRRPTVFGHACRLGLEGIVSKRKGSSYRSGRSPD